MGIWLEQVVPKHRFHSPFRRYVTTCHDTLGTNLHHANSSPQHPSLSGIHLRVSIARTLAGMVPGGWGFGVNARLVIVAGEEALISHGGWRLECSGARGVFNNTAKIVVYGCRVSSFLGRNAANLPTRLKAWWYSYVGLQWCKTIL